MYCIVPLAGPDFYSSLYGVKPLYEIDGEPLITKALHSRNWYRNGELKDDHMIFVLRNIVKTEKFEEYLHEKFRKSKTVKISDFTKGALLSALAATALIENFRQPIVVDLVDILYESDFSPTKVFECNDSIYGILPYFQSTHEKYSYLELANDYVIRTVEKKVISKNASAGTYFFRDLATFLRSVEDSVMLESAYAVKSNLFLCPSFNRIIKDGKNVLAVKVREPEEISLKFHNTL